MNEELEEKIVLDFIHELRLDGLLSPDDAELLLERSPEVGKILGTVLRRYGLYQESGDHQT